MDLENTLIPVLVFMIFAVTLVTVVIVVEKFLG